LRLAVFTGQYFWFDGQLYSTDEAFINYVTSFHPHFEKITLCDAVMEERGKKDYILDPAKVDLCDLPYFSVYSFWNNILCIYPRIYRITRENIHRWDVIWLHAPHPISLIFALVCRMKDVPFFFFIRQNMRNYVKLRNRGIRRGLAMLAATVLEHTFRHLSKKALTFTVGREMFDFYRDGSSLVYETSVSLVSAEDIRCTEQTLGSDRGVVKRLLTVGRLDPEKGVTYLIQAVEHLVGNGRTNVSLEVVGTGIGEQPLRREVQERGLTDFVHFRGYVSFGPQLLKLYRRSDVFVLPSLTEGSPQTIFEAMACGLPVVATRVGGIPHLIEDGRNGLLVNPAAPQEICNTVERLIRDPGLRERLIRNGLKTVKDHTLEAERDRIIRRLSGFFRQKESYV
jgi:glycosyltransferase involved in cell wall biosynthesis